MALPSDFDRGELWYKSDGSTFPTAFTAASTFVATATKLKVFDLDFSGIEQGTVPDTTLQTAFEAAAPPHRTTRAGSFSFKMWLEGGSSDTTPPTVATLLGHVLGGIKSPTAITDAAETDSTATTIKCTSHGMDENDLVLVGVRGDSGGDGRVAPILDASAANEYTLGLALPAAPANTAVLKNGHQVWIDWADETYLNFLFVGTHAGTGATDDSDQFQFIGCNGTVEVGGLGLDEKPFIQFNMMVGDWQHVPYADQATLDPTEAVNGEDPVDGQQSGALVLQDASSTVRNTVAADEYMVSYGYELRMVVDPNNNNRCGGWRKVRAEPSKIGFKAYWAKLADMPGLTNDAINKTAKKVLLQLGHVAQSAVCWYAQNAYLLPLAPSNREDLEGNSGLSLEFICSTPAATAQNTDALKQQDSALILSFN